MSVATASLPPDRIPEPPTRFAGPGGNIRIEGGNVQKETPTRGRTAPIPTVPAEIRPDDAPGAARSAVLEGGPADGLEVRVSRLADEHRVPTARTEGAGVVGEAVHEIRKSDKCPDGRVVQKIVGGDFASALYLRSDRRDEDGRPVYEFAGVE